MLQYQNQTELDKARSEWFQLAGERKRQREEHQRQLEDARSKHKEWWNLDETGHLQGKKLEADRQFGDRKEEGRVNEKGVTRGGIYRGT
jgi:COX assembly protein 1